MDTKPIAIDKSYKIRDNQFWYNDCSFIDIIRNKKSIVVNIHGLGVRELKHAKKGTDNRPTLSYTFSDEEDRDWWIKNRGEVITVELLSVSGISQ